METTQILMDEHKHILKRLDLLEGYLNQPISASVEEIEETLDFIRNYADYYHHGKEEDIYFKWLGKKDPSIKEGPINCMLHEHEQGRSYVSAARELFVQYKNKNRSELEDEIKSNLKNYIDLLREHIDKENNILYPMADEINKKHNDGDQTMLEDFHRASKELGETIARFL